MAKSELFLAFWFWEIRLMAGYFLQNDSMNIEKFAPNFLNDIGPIFLQTIPIPVQAQRPLILYFCFFFKDNKAHNVHDKGIHYQNSITKPHTRAQAVGCSKHFLSNDPGKQRSLTGSSSRK